MGHVAEINYVAVIREVFNNSKALTSGEKEYFNENLMKWVDEDRSLNLLISKFSEISLDIRPILRQKGILV